jgi:hypothetical protein
MFSPGHKLRVSIIQRVILAGVCLPSELAELGGEVRCELWELLGRELAGDEAAERENIVQKKIRISVWTSARKRGDPANI